MKKVFVLDTNVLMQNNYAPYIVSGNEIPEDDAKQRYFNHLETSGKKLDDEPNDVIILDIVKRELDNINHDEKRHDFSPLMARTALHTIEDMLELYDYIPENIKKDVLTYGNSKGYLELENGAKLYFMEHDESEFKKLNIPDANHDDRIIYQIRKLKAENPDNKYIFISADSNARTDAKTKEIDAEDFEYENIRDPNQLYSGISKHPILKEYAEIINDSKSFDLTEKECERILSKPLKQNQIVEFFDKSNEVLNYYIAKKNDEYFTLKPIFAKTKLLDEIKKNNDSLEQRVKDIFTLNKTSSKDVQHDLKCSLESIAHSKLKANGRKRIGKAINALNANDTVQVEKIKKEIAKYEEKKTVSDIQTIGFNAVINTRIIPNPSQVPYLELLNDKDVGLLSVNGAAGTGKTYFALLAGLLQCNKGEYDCISYYKPLVGADAGLGFLPGEQSEKMKPWIMPAMDNLQEIFSYGESGLNYKDHVSNHIDKLIADGLIEFKPITHERGTSWRNKFVLVDDAQLLTKLQIEMLIGRVAKGSKLMLLGDLNQISSKRGQEYEYITKRNSGLAHVIESLPGNKVFAHICLEDVERSEVAKLAYSL